MNIEVMGNRFRERAAEAVVEDKVVEEGLVAEEAVQPAAADSRPAENAGSVKGARVARGVTRILGGDLLADKMVLRQIPLLILCLIFLLLIVGNRYRVENLSREKLALQERINDLREHRIQMQKQYQKSVKISQIAEDLSHTGVGITSGPPYEI